jgi:hypothetical protein
MTSGREQSELAENVARWAEATRASLASAGITLSHRLSDGVASIEAEGEQRLGFLTIWPSGELDTQVLRRADEFAVLNDHRRIKSPDELLNALNLFKLAIAYTDQHE